MTIAELIEKLKEHPPETLVLVSGYEGNYDPLNEVRHIMVHHEPTEHYWDGDWTDWPPEKCNTPAVLLPR